jgi:hypothetical protein
MTLSCSTRTAWPVSAPILGGLTSCKPRTGSGSGRWIWYPLPDAPPPFSPPDRHGADAPRRRGRGFATNLRLIISPRRETTREPAAPTWSTCHAGREPTTPFVESH